MPPWQQVALWANLQRVQAQQYLRAHGGELLPDDLYDMTLLATGSKEQAEEAMYQSIKERLKRGLPTGPA